ncbi:MAG: hypothetical protein GY795_36550 [Desulfobacterales bacterium]|nr:hypothetical protein [Desulfobacterales bacterium]
MKFLELVKEYQNSVNESVRLFSLYLGIDNPGKWYEKGLTRTGSFGPDKIFSYYFHGIGCEFNFGKYTVDYDFGYGGRFDGFDEWRLWLYANYGTDRFNEFRNKEFLKSCFEKAIYDDLIKNYFQQFNDNLYYLTDKGRAKLTMR